MTKIVKPSQVRCQCGGYISPMVSSIQPLENIGFKYLFQQCDTCHKKWRDKQLIDAVVNNKGVTYHDQS